MVVNLFRDRNVKNGRNLVIFSIAFSKIHKKIKKYCISSCIAAKNMLYCYQHKIGWSGLAGPLPLVCVAKFIFAHGKENYGRK